METGEVTNLWLGTHHDGANPTGGHGDLALPGSFRILVGWETSLRDQRTLHRFEGAALG
jgi:hypothetical protein